MSKNFVIHFYSKIDYNIYIMILRKEKIKERHFRSITEYGKYCQETPFEKLVDRIDIFIKDQYLCSIERHYEGESLYSVPLGLDFAKNVKLIGKIGTLTDIVVLTQNADKNSRKEILKIFEEYEFFIPVEKLPRCIDCKTLDQLRIFYFKIFEQDPVTTFNYMMFEGILFKRKVYMFKGIHLLPTSYNMDFINKKSPYYSKVRGELAEFTTWIAPADK